MRFFTFAFTALSVLLPLVVATGPSYFYIRKPAKAEEWVQGSPHAITWVHAIDDIDIVDIELARLGSPGLLFAAREVPTKWGAINLVLTDVPPGQDYYMIFNNVTHGVVYSISEPFTVLPSSTTSSNSDSSTTPDSSKPTVTVSGWPNPTQTFAATFGPNAASAVSLVQHSFGLSLTSALTILGILVGGIWTVL